jgi:hypothetical protein
LIQDVFDTARLKKQKKGDDSPPVSLGFNWTRLHAVSHCPEWTEQHRVAPHHDTSNGEVTSLLPSLFIF